MLIQERLDEPARRKKPAIIGVQLMGDLFHKDVCPHDIYQVFEAARKAPQHTYLFLTKRSAGMLGATRMYCYHQDQNWKQLPDNWIGMVTAENQEWADKRVSDLLEAPWAVRGISAEPLLSAIDLQDFLGYYREAETVTDFDGHSFYKRPGRGLCHHDGIKLDWVITGGESGPGARPMRPDWARGLRDQCQAAGVAYRFKQWGEWIPQDHWDGSGIKYEPHFWPGHIRFASYRVGNKRAGHLLDGQEWRQMPKVKR